MLFECGSAPRAIGERAFGESDHPERNEKPPSIGQIQIPARHVYIGRSAFGFCPALEYASFETVSSQRLVGASAFFSRWYGVDGDRFPCRADWVGAFQLCRALRFVPLGTAICRYPASAGLLRAAARSNELRFPHAS